MFSSLSISNPLLILPPLSKWGNHFKVSYMIFVLYVFLLICIFQFCGRVILFHIHSVVLLNSHKDLCLWLSSALYLTVGKYPMECVQYSSALPGQKSRFTSTLYNQKPCYNGPVDPLSMDLCKNFSGARSLGQDAGSGIVDRFIHNLMKYCKVTLQKGSPSLFLSKTWCSIVSKFHSFVGWIKWSFSSRHSYFLYVGKLIAYFYWLMISEV